ncbi:uncharacterized protein EI90DRAFT_783023 [Cantharellus anzutake]|uniref:uncharacterized protein n=1 Tax=Cantharellus anzutake TaxID=1750568 RepID=UPI00190699CD|nr:uncharacterized protein EI90DRAFT_783023 [Cantharellus anzutake]KAF8342756.1 hypothetical protein EI90DRAFT_783023 [Cantharellus anzutake]
MLELFLDGRRRQKWCSGSQSGCEDHLSDLSMIQLQSDDTNVAKARGHEAQPLLLSHYCPLHFGWSRWGHAHLNLILNSGALPDIRRGTLITVRTNVGHGGHSQKSYLAVSHRPRVNSTQEVSRVNMSENTSNDADTESPTRPGGVWGLEANRSKWNRGRYK